MTLDTKQAAADIRTMIVAGVVLGVLGGLLAGLAWPHTTVDSLVGLEEHGSRGAALIGLGIAWAGNAMLLVGLIAQGARMGRNASPSAD